MVLAPEQGIQLRPLLSLRRLEHLRLCNSGQLAAAMAAGPGDTTRRLSPRQLCLDGNSLSSSQLPHMLSWFKLGTLQNLDLRYNSLSALPQVCNCPLMMCLPATVRTHEVFGQGILFTVIVCVPWPLQCCCTWWK